MTKFAGKNILVTGGAGGLGRLMALDMASKGGRVIIWDMNREGMDRVVTEAKSNGHNVCSYYCDMSKKQMIKDVSVQVLKDHKRIDILINNAGIVTGKSFFEASEEEIILTMNVNTLACFWTVRAFSPHMIERNSGHIVNIASAAGMVGVDKLADYCSSKFAVFGFSESLRMEFNRRHLNIETTLVCPYFINTGMFDGVKSRFSLLLPILNEKRTAQKIVKAIQKNRKELIMPPFVALIPLARIFPTWFFDGLMNSLGVNSSMKDFVGKR